jgi:hypothetical protein
LDHERRAAVSPFAELVLQQVDPFSASDLGTLKRLVSRSESPDDA